MTERESHPKNPVYFVRDSVTHVPGGTVEKYSAYGDNLEDIVATVKPLEALSGGKVFDIKDKKSGRSSSSTIGFGGTKWNASWTPSADVKRAQRAGDEAAKRTPPQNPRAN